MKTGDLFLNSKTMNLRGGKIKSIVADPEKSAKVVNLQYVNDSQEGILRQKRGKYFTYFWKNTKVTSKEILDRIKKLVIPPAWTNVWICASENGHLQATGWDARQRKQYKYHHHWNFIRNHTKYYRLHDFGKAVPGIRKRLERDLKMPGMPQEKVLAAVVSLMELTSIRIGNNLYEKLYGSYGLTTLQNKHVRIKGVQLQFTFKGKKGISHKISIRSKKLCGIIKKCMDTPGKELFCYLDENGEARCIDSGMVNNYIKEISSGDFTAKDFRTWAGTVQALAAFREISFADTAAATKRNIVAALDTVAKHLGNTRTVCKKYYVHPIVLSLYENQKLKKYFEREIHVDREHAGLSDEERLLMYILEKETFAIDLPAA